MSGKNKFSGLIGPSDDGFRNAFDNTILQFNSEEKGSRRVRRPRWQIAAAVAAACIALTGTAYAVSLVIVDRVDVGASWELVTAPEDYYESTGDSILHTIYNSDVSIEEQRQLDAQMIEELRKLLDGQIFNEKGEAIDIIVTSSDSDGFSVDTGGSALYNEAGEELYLVCYETIGYSGPLSLWLYPKAEYEGVQAANGEDAQITESRAERDEKIEWCESQGFGWAATTDDYEEAAERLGVDFALPGDFYTEGRAAPEFNINKTMSGKMTVYVTYKGIDKYDRGLYYNVSPMREDGQMPEEVFVPGLVFNEYDLNGMTMYIGNDYKSYKLYIWSHNGVAYRLFQDYSPWELTDEQIFEIIESMMKWNRAEYDAQKKEIEEQSFGSVERTWENTEGYEQAAKILGVDFALPGDSYTEGRGTPLFIINKLTSGTMIVRVMYKGLEKYDWDWGLQYHVAPMRENEQKPNELLEPSIVFNEYDLNGMTVYIGTDYKYVKCYVWAHEGVAYRWITACSPTDLTEEQVFEIIESMIK